jgi:hypothetical protein
MVDKKNIQSLLNLYFTVSASTEIQDDGSVNVSGNVSLAHAPSKGIIPVKFGIVDGEFRAENKQLTSLRNVPDACHSLYVGNNLIQSLEYSPVYLNVLNVENNLLTNFEHAPEQVDKIFAFGNPLTGLQGLPDSELEYDVNITYGENLPLLRLLNAETVHIGKPEGGYARLQPFEPVNTIINKYTGQGKSGAIKCAAELVRAGFKDNARW